MHGEHENFGGRNGLAELTNGLDTIEVGHTDVDYSYIRFQVYGLLHRFPATRCFADDSPTATGVKDPTRTPPHEFVIVGYQDAKFFHVCSRSRGRVTRTVVP